MTKDSMQADKGTEWAWCDRWQELMPATIEDYRQAMHDRDRLQRERDWEREQRT